MDARIFIRILIAELAEAIATMATLGGSRYDLQDIDERLFREVAHALERRDMSQRAVAELLGMTRRAYQRRRGRDDAANARATLFARVLALFDYFDSQTESALLRKFRTQDRETMHAVLNDLVASQRLERDRVGRATTYRRGPRFGPDTSATTIFGREGVLRLMFLIVRSLERASTDDLAWSLRLDPDEVARLVVEAERAGWIQWDPVRRGWMPCPHPAYLTPTAEERKRYELAAVTYHIRSALGAGMGRFARSLGQDVTGARPALANTFQLELDPATDHAERLDAIMKRWETDMRELLADTEATRAAVEEKRPVVAVRVYFGQVEVGRESASDGRAPPKKATSKRASSD